MHPLSVVLRRAVAEQASNGTTAVPEPVVKIDNQSDAFATLVTVEFGDKLGELLDTVRRWKAASFLAAERPGDSPPPPLAPPLSSHALHSLIN